MKLYIVVYSTHIDTHRYIYVLISETVMNYQDIYLLAPTINTTQVKPVPLEARFLEVKHLILIKDTR